MLRGRRGKPFTVELDLGQFGDVGVDDADDEHDDEPAGEVPAMARARRGRAVIAAGLVAFLAFSAWGATAEIQARHSRANLVSAPGGVLSLARPISSAWTVEADIDHVPVFMPGLVVAQRGAQLHGLDAGTGTERWQVEVGASATCGPTQTRGQGTVLVDPMVCITTQPDGRQIVTVVRAEGAAATRELDEEGATAAAATADGGVVTIRRTGSTPPPPDAHVTTESTGGFAVEGSVAAGQDVVVRLEDAQTGALRWERTLTFTPVEDASTCGMIVVDSDNQATFDATHLSVTVTTQSSLVDVQGCGIQGLFTATGEPVAQTSPETSVSWLEPYVDGGVLRHESSPDGQIQTLLNPDGTTTRFADQVLTPLATDGTHPDVVLLSTSDLLFRARDRRGSPLWANALSVTQVLARTSHVAVVMLGGAVAGIDMETGKTLWVDPASFLESANSTRDRTQTAVDLGSSASILSWTAFTDGQRVTLALENFDATAVGLITIDPMTGDVLWRAMTSPSTNDWTQYYAVEGHVISFSVVVPAPGVNPTSATITAWH